MKQTINYKKSITLMSVLLGSALGAIGAEDGTDGSITVLDKFIASETAASKSGDLMPTSRPSDSVFGSKTIMEIPRSVTVLTPDLMEKFGVRNFDDLARVTAGGERPNYYGVPGSPVLRGDFAGTFFNGMQRTFQRNEMPTSFGSLDGMDVVKGPAPGNLGATQGGGYVNFLPKSPYFDKFRGSLRTTVGSYDYFNTQVDVGGPFLLFTKPAAFRVSVVNQQAESYYDNVNNDFISLYGALKLKLTDNIAVFTGGEYYKFKSNENAGWNRVTQDLIDNGNYIVGRAVDATSAAAGGKVAPANIAFVNMPTGPGSQPVAFGPSPALIPPASFVAGLTPAQRALLGPNGEYTAAYLNAGGPVATTKLEGNQVLSDASDFANSEDFLYFLDFVYSHSPAITVKNQTLFEYLNTEKLSSYGYAFNSKQYVFENKTTVDQKFDGILTNLTYGASLRYNFAHQLQDFQVEPFSRRDVSSSVIDPNSVVLTGPQRLVTGDTRNFWSQGADSDLYTAGLFTVGELKFSEQFSTFVSLRGEGAKFVVHTPGSYERSATRGQKIAQGGKNYYMASINPIFKVSSKVSLYLAGQYGTALNPSQGGTVTSESNFGETELLEAGVKTSLIDNKLFASFAAYYTTLSRFNNITNNPYGLRTKGVEMELTYVHSKNFSLIANIGGRRTEQTSMPGFRFQATQDYYMPLVAGGLFAGGNANTVLITQNNPDTIFPGSPEFVANVFASYELDNGLGFAFGPTFRGSYWHNFEHTIKLPSTQIWNANVSYKKGPIELLLEVTNVFSEDYFYGSDPTFAANTDITKAPPIQTKLSFTYKF